MNIAGVNCIEYLYRITNDSLIKALYPNFANARQYLYVFNIGNSPFARFV